MKYADTSHHKTLEPGFPDFPGYTPLHGIHSLPVLFWLIAQKALQRARFRAFDGPSWAIARHDTAMMELEGPDSPTFRGIHPWLVRFGKDVSSFSLSCLVCYSIEQSTNSKISKNSKNSKAGKKSRRNAWLEGPVQSMCRELPKPLTNLTILTRHDVMCDIMHTPLVGKVW